MKLLKYNQLMESQKFDFETNKKSVINFIEKCKENKPIHHFDNPFYTIITGNRSFSNLFTDDIKKKWNTFFKNKSFITDGVWSQRRFNTQYKKNPDRTYNYYITIDKDVNNILLFINKLGLLDKALSDLSNSSKQQIAYKTHTILDMMVNHNDSLKIYYYEPSIKQSIEDVVKNWVIDNNIKLSNRTHTHGVDAVINKGEDKKSFGEILADTVGNQFKLFIEKYGKNYTSEQYYNWIKNNMGIIIKNVKIDYKK
jgi:hypothetical protein